MKASDISAVNEALKREYEKDEAPVAEFERARTEDPFRVLVSTILSARTKDGTTSAAVDRLFGVVKGPADLRKIALRRLEKLIFPVGFYRTKARHLKLLPRILDEKFAGRIPRTVEDLCELPGVGRKTANLVVAVGFDKPAICVDVHVHRICNRLGLVSTRTPFETEMALRGTLRVEYWKTWNSYLVSYGQTVCSPISPKCDRCVIFGYCDRVGVKTKHMPSPA